MKLTELQASLSLETFYGNNMAIVLKQMSSDEQAVIERFVKICEGERLCLGKPLESMHLGENPSLDKLLELHGCNYDLIVEFYGSYFYFYHDNFVAAKKGNYLHIHAKL